MELLRIADGQARVLDAFPTAPAAGLLWCDCTYDEARAWVEPLARLTGGQILEDHLLDAENRLHPSSFEATSDYEFVLLRGLVTTTAELEQAPRVVLETRPTAFFVLPGVLVTVRAPDSHTVPRIRRRLLGGGPGGAGGVLRLPSLPEELMLRIVDTMIDRYLELRNPLTERLERWQRELLAPQRQLPDWYALLQSRNTLRRLEGICEDQIEALQGWRDERLEREEPTGAPRHLSEALLVRVNDLIEHVHRVLNHVRRLEASIETAVQLHFSATAHRQNEVMRTLTLLTAVFLPLTLITGIFGMNFEFIPGLQSPFGFWMTLLGMGLVAAAMWGFFRARRWVEDRTPKPGRAGAVRSPSEADRTGTARWPVQGDRRGPAQTPAPRDSGAQPPPDSDTTQRR